MASIAESKIGCHVKKYSSAAVLALTGQNRALLG